MVNWIDSKVKKRFEMGFGIITLLVQRNKYFFVVDIDEVELDCQILKVFKIRRYKDKSIYKSRTDAEFMFEE
jgi:hypothetical protein